MSTEKAGPMGVEEIDELERLEQAATPGRWEFWTSNSLRRFSVDGGRDGGVAHAYVARDGVPDISIDHEDGEFICAARNALPRLLALARSALTAEAAGREKGLEEAAEWVRLGRWHDPDSCAAGIRALAQPSATRKEE
jgi:hypothetical protein